MSGRNAQACDWVRFGPELLLEWPMRWILDTCWGIYELARLGVLSGFDFKGPYWQWRMHTAFGRGTPPRAELIRSVLDYGRWMHRMRRSAHH